MWIWMGIRSDDRCGRDFGTDHVQHTTCGKGSCCSSHGWCGTTDRQHRPSPHTLRALTSLAALILRLYERIQLCVQLHLLVLHGGQASLLFLLF